MSELTVVQDNTGVEYIGSAVRGRMTKYGERYMMDWRQRRLLQGYGFGIELGALSTEVTGGGDGTVVDLDQPELGMTIPDGTTIVILKLAMQLLFPLLAADDEEVEALAFVDTTAATVTAALDGTWTTTETPKNLIIQTTNPRSSDCTVKTLCTVDTTDPTESYDLIHRVFHGDVQGTAANGLWQAGELLYPQPGQLAIPYIKGPASLFAYVGGTVATNFFLQFEWLEYPTTDLFG